MKFLGFSFGFWLAILLAVFIGTRKPDLFGSLPILGK